MIELGHQTLAIAIDEEQRHQHEKRSEQELERGGAGRDKSAIDIADIGAADRLGACENRCSHLEAWL